MNKLETILAGAAARKRQAHGEKSKSGRKAAVAGAGSIFTRLADLYERMEAAYRLCADSAGLTCDGCENNCCTSFFQHHTHIEWAYLWRGLRELPPGERKLFVRRSRAYVDDAGQSLASGRLPSAMCPLNDAGLCVLYSHRLMICRLHGTRNVFRLPDGRRQYFPGCGRFAGLPCASEGKEDACPTLDRTAFYQELAALELEFLKRAAGPMPRVDMTLAEMIVMGPPRLGT